METKQNYCIKSGFLSKLILPKDGLMIGTDLYGILSNI